jgi:hypothetical protein
MQLNKIVLGLGAVEGYSGDDLTNPYLAFERGEVAYLKPNDPVNPLEIRIHGVGGAPATENLEASDTLQVAGDAEAGFHRPWYPGADAPTNPRTEAYCWGKLNVHAWWSALWLMLIPFGLANTAHWALPGNGHVWMRYMARVTVRVLGLVLTVGLIAMVCYLSIDLLAVQSHSAVTWTWLRWDSRSVGTRIAIASAAPIGVLALLWWLSRQGTSRYHGNTPGSRIDSVLSPDQIPPGGVRLAEADFWDGGLSDTRTRHCHVIAGAATVLGIVALPHVDSGDAARTTLLAVAAALAALALAITCTRGSDRRRPKRLQLRYRPLQLTAWGSLLLSIGAAVSRVWWQPSRSPVSGARPVAPAIPYDADVQVVLFFIPIGVTAALFLLVLLHQPHRQGDVFIRGYASVLFAGAATAAADVFGATATYAFADFLGRPANAVSCRDYDSTTRQLCIPDTAWSGGFAFVVTLVSALVVGTILTGIWITRARALRTRQRPGDLDTVYVDRSPAGVQANGKARRRVASAWSRSQMTDHVAWAVLSITLPTLAALVSYEALQMAKNDEHWSITTAQIGVTLAVFIDLAFLSFVWAAIRTAGKRKRIGFFWDVLTFWPRAGHPFAPRSYGERAVPELVTRVRRAVGADSGGDDDPALAQQAAEGAHLATTRAIEEEHSPVLLIGYSQGAPIATAAAMQLSSDLLAQDAQHRIALITFASPDRRLYGRAFPAYFGHRHLMALYRALADVSADGAALDPAQEEGRWLNLIRRSDYIGGWNFNPHFGESAGSSVGVDREIFDPPVLWNDTDPSPPPIHLHSDWFPDPQTRPFVNAMAERL